MYQKYKLIILCFLLIITACSSNKRLGHDPNLFNSSDFSFRNIVSSKIYRSSQDEIDLYFNLNLKELPTGKRKKSGEETKAILPLRFKYVLFRNSGLKDIIDSVSVQIESDPEHRHNLQYLFRNIRCTDKAPVLHTELYDPGNRNHIFDTRWIDLNSENNSNSFRIRHLPDSLFNAQTSFSAGDSLTIEYFKPQVKKLFVHYSRSIGRPAPPPFYFGNDKVPVAAFDTSFTIFNGALFIFPKEGNYLIQADTTKKEGLWLNCFADGFPQLGQGSELVYSMIYLLSADEFQNMLKDKDSSQAVANFWNKGISNEKRAATLADLYFSRVERANELFSTSKEGWKTDRGMIYTLFGKPDIIYKQNWGENWIYHEHFMMPQVEFHFTRSIQPWGEDFTLTRDERMRSPWYLAVDAWRNGRPLGNDEF